MYDKSKPNDKKTIEKVIKTCKMANLPILSGGNKLVINGIDIKLKITTKIGPSRKLKKLLGFIFVSFFY
tara:strand:+ start:165 stop:371 length:207 start_codon:yes stop_codon:yes gene_type:complete